MVMFYCVILSAFQYAVNLFAQQVKSGDIGNTFKGPTVGKQVFYSLYILIHGY